MVIEICEHAHYTVNENFLRLYQKFLGILEFDCILGHKMWLNKYQMNQTLDDSSDKSIIRIYRKIELGMEQQTLK